MWKGFWRDMWKKIIEGVIVAIVSSSLIGGFAFVAKQFDGVSLVALFGGVTKDDFGEATAKIDQLQRTNQQIERDLQTFREQTKQLSELLSGQPRILKPREATPAQKGPKMETP